MELLKNNELVVRITNIDESFSDIKTELDRIARKRLAIITLVFGIGAVLVGIIK